MTSSSFLPLFVLGLLAVGGFGAWSLWRDSKRRQALQAFCRSQGWSYATDDASLVTRWTGQPFGRGERRRATDVVRGLHQNRPFSAFTYTYVERHSDGKGGSNTTTYRFAVVSLGLPTFLPTLEVQPDNVLTRAASAMGLSSGIELESEDFNRKFRVSARDPKFASDVLTPRTMELLLRSPAHAWRIEGTDLVSWSTGRVDPVGILAELSPLAAVVAGIPTFVWHDHGYDPIAAAPPPVAGPADPPREGSTS